VIDISEEPLISLAAATKFIPPSRGGAPCSFSCMVRWHQKGARAADGSLIRLEALRVGGRLCTSVAALQRFFQALSARPGEASAPSRTPTIRRRAIEQADRICEEAGV
jgi:hypothetical protein